MTLEVGGHKKLFLNLVNYREGVVGMGLWPALVRQGMKIGKSRLSIFGEGLQVKYCQRKKV